MMVTSSTMKTRKILMWKIRGEMAGKILSESSIRELCEMETIWRGSCW